MARLEKQKEDAEERASTLETEALSLRQEVGDAEILARDAAAERDRYNLRATHCCSC